MRNRSDFIIKTLLMFFLMVTIIFMVGFFLVIQTQNSIQKSFVLANEDMARKAARSLTQSVNRYEEEISDYSSVVADFPNELLKKLPAVEYVAKTNGTAVKLFHNENFSAVAAQATFKGASKALLGESRFYVAQFEELFEFSNSSELIDQEDANFVVLTSGKSEAGTLNAGDPGGDMYHFFINEEAFFKTFDGNSFEDYYIVSNEKVLLMKIGEGFSGEYKIFRPNSTFPNFQEHQPKDTDYPVSWQRSFEVGEESILVPYLFSAKKLIYPTPTGLEYYFVGATDYTAPQTEIDTFMGNALLVLSICFAGLFGVCMTYGILIARSRKALFLVGERNFLVVTDGDGKIINTNEDYKRDFLSQDLAASVMAGSFRNDFKRGDTVYSVMKDRKMTRRVIKYTVIGVKKRKKVVTKFDFLGHDITDESYSMAEAYVTRNVEEIVPLEEMHKKLVWSNKKLLIGRVQIGSYKKIETMFGKQFVDKVYESVLDKLKDIFDYLFVEPDGVIAVLCKSSTTDSREKALGEVMNACNQPISIQDNLISGEVKGGFAVMQKGDGNNEFHYAASAVSAALHKAREDEKKSFYVYHEILRKQFDKYLRTDYDIKKLLEEDAFEMQFQPQYSLKKKKIVGFEALLRLKKSATEINIFDLIRYAEQTGNMILLGEFIFEQSMVFAKEAEAKDIVVSVNVSPVQLMQVGFVDHILKMYTQHEISPGTLCVEITESFLMTTYDETVLKLQILRDNGIGVHLDDFGTTYSSLQYLQKLPISAIKIDKSFIDNLAREDDYNRVIAKMVVDICSQLGLDSIAEGVETEEQKAILTEMGCDIIQGYLIGKTTPHKEAIELL